MQKRMDLFLVLGGFGLRVRKTVGQGAPAGILIRVSGLRVWVTVGVQGLGFKV